MTSPEHKEEWEKKLMDEFCVFFERAQDETVVQRLESFIRTTRQEAQREVLEKVMECKSAFYTAGGGYDAVDYNMVDIDDIKKLAASLGIPLE